MNWEAIGAIANILAAIGVILSLLFLTKELRHSNRLAKRAATQKLIDGRIELNRFLASDQELNELFWKGLETPSELNEREWKRFISIISNILRNCESIYLDHKEGLLVQDIWQSQNNFMRRWLSKPGAQRILVEFGSDFNPDFIRHVLVHHESEEPKEMLDHTFPEPEIESTNG